MLNYPAKDVVEALQGAKNANAALKKFLKNEVRSDPKSEKFIKNLKVVLGSKISDNKESFIEKNLPTFEPHLFVLARYAYAEETGALAEEVLKRYAEEFNTTYSQGEDRIEIKDPAKFKKIVLEVVALLENGLKNHSIPNSNFMKNVMFYHIFDRDVLDEVIPLVKKG